MSDLSKQLEQFIASANSRCVSSDARKTATCEKARALLVEHLPKMRDVEESCKLSVAGIFLSKESIGDVDPKAFVQQPLSSILTTSNKFSLQSIAGSVGFDDKIDNAARADAFLQSRASNCDSISEPFLKKSCTDMREFLRKEADSLEMFETIAKASIEVVRRTRDDKERTPIALSQLRSKTVAQVLKGA